MQATVFPTDAAVKTIIQSPFRETKYLKKKDLIAALKDSPDLYIRRMGATEILNQFEPGQQDNIKRTQRFIQSFKNAGAEPSKVMQDILDRADVLTYYETEEESDRDNDAKENINELSKVAGRYNSVPDFLDHARRAIAASRKSKQPRLSLSTIHQAKGKEWDHVFVCGVNHEVLPHKRGQLMEERRIFYVACTRAAKTLTVSFFGTPSTFLKEVYTPGDEDQDNRQPLPGFQGQPNLFEGLD
jgi:superfamily I DNA/RNA helicase